MKSPHWLAALALITACSDDKKNTPPPDETPPDTVEPATGVFSDSPVAQLHYVTATQSGMTDASGTFKYLAGETVTFSVGGIVLGSAAAATQVTPFDLFAVTPPVTINALKLVFAEDGTPTPFESAANVAALLLALDVDHDPSNGIDLTGSDTALAGAAINFTSDVTAFITDRLGPLLRRTNTGHLVQPAAATAHLYATLGLKVPATIITRYNNVGDIHEMLYDAAGRLTTVRDGASADVWDQTELFAYDTHGRLFTETLTSDDYTRVITHTYDDFGFETEITAVASTAGTEEARSTEKRTYDAVGNVVTDTEETVVSGVTSSKPGLAYTYDANGRLSTRVLSGLSTTTYTYDEAGHLAQTDEVDDATSHDKLTFTYDAKGLIATQRGDRYAGDAPHGYNERVFTRDAAGRVTLDVLTIYDVAGAPQTRQSHAMTYDANGRVSLETYENSDTPFTVIQRDTVTTIFDAAGNTLTVTDDYDAAGDGGAPDAHTVTTYAYAGDGAPLGYHYERMVNGAITSTEDNTYGSTALADALGWFLSDVAPALGSNP